MSEINQAIRQLLRSTALGIADRDQVPPGVLHVISARDLLLGALMQEFNSAMVNGLSADEPLPVARGETEPPANPSAEILIGSDLLPSPVEITPEKSIQLGEIVAQAHSKSGLSADEWNAMPSSDREVLLDAYIDELKAAESPALGIPTSEAAVPDVAVDAEANGGEASTDDAGQVTEEASSSRRKRGSA